MKEHTPPAVSQDRPAPTAAPAPDPAFATAPGLGNSGFAAGLDLGGGGGEDGTLGAFARRDGGGADPAAPVGPTPEENAAAIASVATPPILATPADPPVTLSPAGIDGMKSDSPDPIQLKDQVVSLTKAYLALPPETSPADRQAKLDAIKATFEALRAAMAHARGEDNKLTSLRVGFEKFLGQKAEGEWPQGVQCVDAMVNTAKSMIVAAESGVAASAAEVDAQFLALPEDVRAAVGKKLGSATNLGFAGVVGKSFGAINEALTNGSLVQKAQGLIGFTDNYLVPKLMDGAGPVFDLAKAKLAEAQPEIQLAQLIDAAKGKPPKEQKAILLTSPEFRAKLAQVKGDNAGLDAERGAENKEAQLGGGMDTKIPEQPIEVCDDAQLEFIAGELSPPIDLSDCPTRSAKVDKLKAAGVTTTKPPGSMVDATSIVEAVEGVTVDNKAYIEGKLENIVDPKNTWILNANEAEAPLKAGISGTTARFVGAANLLGGTKEGAVVAMLGHLQKIEAHSFWEIVDAAGIGLSAGTYVPFSPNDAGMRAAAAEYVDANGFADLGVADKAAAQKKLLGEAA